MQTGADFININYTYTPLMLGGLDFTPQLWTANFTIEPSLEDINLRIERGRIAAEARLEVLLKAKTVIDRCNSAEIKDNVEKAYLKELARYLEKRKTEPLRFRETSEEQELQIKIRTDLITKIVDAVIAGDRKKELEQLQEQNIKPFKGWWSKRLYNLLYKRRLTLESQEKNYQAKCRVAVEPLRKFELELPEIRSKK